MFCCLMHLWSFSKDKSIDSGFAITFLLGLSMKRLVNVYFSHVSVASLLVDNVQSVSTLQ
jgi:hypothetical protein